MNTPEETHVRAQDHIKDAFDSARGYLRDLQEQVTKAQQAIAVVFEPRPFTEATVARVALAESEAWTDTIEEIHRLANRLELASETAFTIAMIL